MFYVFSKDLTLKTRNYLYLNELGTENMPQDLT